MTTLSTIAEVLEREGVYVGVTSGVSMWPMIRDRCDTVVVRPPCGRLRRFDVACTSAMIAMCCIAWWRCWLIRM